MPKFEKGSEAAKEHMRKVREGRKLKNNYEKMKNHEDLIMTNTAEIAVPKTLLYIDGKGEHKIIKTVTKAGTLTRRDKKPVIKIEPHEDNTVRIKNSGTTKAGRSKNLLNEIHASSNEKYKREYDELYEEYYKALNSKSKSKVREERLKKYSALMRQFEGNNIREHTDHGQPNKMNFKNERLHAPKLIESKKMKEITDELDKLGKKKINTKT
mgnify:CR=1 FL=1